ncbi:MAG TPA: hypothetical protein VKE70_36480, partial [Candidatus Solibacter sp.]|nr:hypothetical protein [Candidatus Solibacter sp.]
AKKGMGEGLAPKRPAGGSNSPVGDFVGTPGIAALFSVAHRKIKSLVFSAQRVGVSNPEKGCSTPRLDFKSFASAGFATRAH